MKNLLIDIGNTNIKTAFGTETGNKISSVKRKHYKKNNFKKEFPEFLKSLKPITEIDKIGISSLDKREYVFIKNTTKKIFNVDPIFVRIDIDLPIKIHYSETLGNDRICSAVAADNTFPNKNILIIDFGTATTFTLMSYGILIGGIISPGILTAFDSLTEKTNLKKINPEFPKKLINQTTEDNIKAGVLFQTLFFCESVIKALKKDYKELKVILTGGFCNIMKDKLNRIDLVERDLVFKGINLILNFNEDLN